MNLTRKELKKIDAKISKIEELGTELREIFDTSSDRNDQEEDDK